MIDKNVIQINGKSYQVIKKLGKGAQGSAYQAQNIQDGITYTVKISKNAQDNIINMLKIRMGIHHKYIQQLIDYELIQERNGDKQLFQVLEFVEKSGQEFEIFEDQDQFLRTVLKICSAVSHLHKIDIVIRDIKGTNILYTENRDPKLCDLDLAIQNNTESDVAGTANFIPPEAYKAIFNNQKYICTTKADVWAMGVLIFAFNSLAFPFSGSHFSIFKQQSDVDLIFEYEEISADIELLIRSFLVYSESKRPSIKHVVEKHFVTLATEMGIWDLF